VTTHQAPPALPLAAGHDEGSLLRLALRLDAVASGALGVLLLAAGPLLDELLGTPLGVAWPVGLFLVAFAAALWVAASRSPVSGLAAWAVVVINLLWVVGSVATVAAGWLPLTALGVAFVLVQAAAVALFAGLELLGLRRASPSAR
jgi:hypothetical protein